MTNQEIPYDLEAEKAVIGCVLIDVQGIFQVLHLSPSDFFDDANRIIFQTLKLMHDAGQPTADVTVLVANLRATKKIDTVGGAGYLATLLDGIASTANLPFYASIVKERSEQRNLIRAAESVLKRAYQKESPLAIVQELDSMVSNVGLSEKDFTTTLREEGERRIDRFENDDEDEQTYGAMQCGIDAIDQQYGGLKRGHNIVIGARPSDGKSALGKQIASNVSESGVPVLFVTLEMEASEVADRVFSQRLRMDGRYVEANCYVDREFEQFKQEVAKYSTETFYISAPVGRNATWKRIAGHAAMLCSTKQIGLVVVDYLQLVEKSSERETTYETVTEASKGAKLLARKLKIPVVTLAQIGRDSDKGNRRVPRLSDLRDSGAIEQDADVVMFLHRIEEDRDDFTLVVAKWRNGDKGNYPITLDKKHTQFLPKKDDSF